ncbi:hypothetical protein V6N13_032128 [Hibiscus sabdariffa]
MEHKAMVMIPSHKQRQNNASRTHGLTQRQRLQQDRGAAVKKGKQGRVVRFFAVDLPNDGRKHGAKGRDWSMR